MIDVNGKHSNLEPNVDLILRWIIDLITALLSFRVPETVCVKEPFAPDPIFMKHLPLLLTICFLPVLSGKEVNKDDLIERNGLWYEKFTSAPLTGSVYTEYAGGERVKNGEFVDGLKEGLFEIYYENGQLTSKGSYKDGEFDGPC